MVYCQGYMAGVNLEYQGWRLSDSPSHASFALDNDREQVAHSY